MGRRSNFHINHQRVEEASLVRGLLAGMDAAPTANSEESSLSMAVADSQFRLTNSMKEDPPVWQVPAPPRDQGPMGLACFAVLCAGRGPLMYSCVYACWWGPAGQQPVCVDTWCDWGGGVFWGAKVHAFVFAIRLLWRRCFQEPLGRMLPTNRSVCFLIYLHFSSSSYFFIHPFIHPSD